MRSWKPYIEGLVILENAFDFAIIYIQIVKLELAMAAEKYHRAAYLSETRNDAVGTVGFIMQCYASYCVLLVSDALALLK